jgi:DNA-binding GntR family transcriptional regulator
MSEQDVEAIFRLRRSLEPPLAARAVWMHDAASLDAIERSMAACHDHALDACARYEVLHNAHLNLIRPAMNKWDYWALEPLIRAASRYLLREIDLGGEPASRGCAALTASHHRLLEAFRSRDDPTVHQALHRCLDEAQLAALRAVPHSVAS